MKGDPTRAFERDLRGSVTKDEFTGNCLQYRSLDDAGEDSK
jgi:hypothetical protein